MYIFYSALVLTALAVFAQLCFFIHNNIYQTIYNSDQILILRSMVAIEPINLNDFNEVISSLHDKGQKCARDKKTQALPESAGEVKD